MNSATDIFQNDISIVSYNKLNQLLPNASFEYSPEYFVIKKKWGIELIPFD